MILDVVSEVVRAVQLADVVDIALTAGLLYAFFSWLRGMSHDAAVRILVLVVLFTFVYVLAHFFELYLVERALLGLFIVFVVATVVIFQTELRRLLDRLATWSYTRRSAAGTEGPAVVDVVVEAAEHMARERTGALIALKGREPWEGHLQGGVRLDGCVSQPLLYSLFDPRTAGHDGAVLLDGDRVVRFAAHLPLSTAPPSVSRYGGTRHAAAVGLSEQCDALVVVVSEETGRISIAEEGRLDEVASAEALAARLNRFWRAHHGARDPERAALLRRSRWQTTTLSLLLAGLLWVVFAYSPVTIQRTIEVPVEFRNLPADWELDDVQPDEITVHLAGPEHAFRELDPENLAVSFDASAPVEGRNVFVVDGDNLTLPAEIELTGAEPSELHVSARRLQVVSLPVEVRTEGSLPEPLALDSLRAEPDTVVVLMPAGSVGSDRLATEPVDLRQVEASGTVERALVLPEGWRLPQDRPNEVTVHVTVRRADGAN